MCCISFPNKNNPNFLECLKVDLLYNRIFLFNDLSYWNYVPYIFLTSELPLISQSALFCFVLFVCSATFHAEV